MKNKSLFSVTLFIFVFFLNGCKSYTDCECEEMATQALINYSTRSTGSNWKGIEKCNKRLIKETGSNRKPGEIDISYTIQYFHEKCEYGYYKKKPGFN